MRRDKIDSNGLIERIETMKIWRPVALAGRGRLDGVISFDARIGWLVEQHMRSTAYHGGRELKGISAFIDVGRFGSAIHEVDEAHRFCKHFGVDRNSTLVVKAIAWQTRQPVVMSDGAPREKIWGRREYDLPAEDWMRDEAMARVMMARENGEEIDTPWKQVHASMLHHSREEDFGIINEAEIFNSSWDEAANRSAFDRYAALIERMIAGDFTRLDAAPETGPRLEAPAPIGG